MTKISVCIITFNEEDVIRRCLESVKWADEIIVIDSNSTDRTVSICRQYTNKVYTRQWQGYGQQKNYANSLASHDWILSIDADEELPSTLKEEIFRDINNSNFSDVAAYAFPRKTFFLNRWIEHGGWYPNVITRLFRKGSAYWSNDEVHEELVVKGKLRILFTPLLHFSFKDISDQVKTNNNFSTLGAMSKFRRKESFHYYHLFSKPIVKFFETYFLKRGFLDGLAGLIISVSAAYSVFLKYAKFWELLHINTKTKVSR